LWEFRAWFPRHRALEVAADGFGIAGVEVGDEEESDAEDDKGDEAVGDFLAPDVEEDDFDDADEEEAEAGRVDQRVSVVVAPSRTRRVYHQDIEFVGYEAWVPHPCGFQGCGF
jgi:hypothetical protein